MHLVIDAVAVRPGSAAIVVEHIMGGWAQLAPDDRLTVLADQELCFTVPEGTAVVQLESPVGGPLGSLWLRSQAVRRKARELGADAVLSGVPASALAGTGSRDVPHGFIMYDLRHELRPQQFPRSRRLSRAVSWGLAMRRTDHMFCISGRTLHDLQALHPRQAAKGVVARLGADHVESWVRTWPDVRPADPPYALAFGHFSNKNVDAVLESWREFCRTNSELTLRIVGLGNSGRTAVVPVVERLGIADRVELMPWLDDEEFRRCFAESSLVVFPSDFEGFGLPAIEALHLGIPVVVSTDEALQEITGGHAETTPSTSPADLAAAMTRAVAHTPEQTAAGRTWSDDFTWRACAAVIRERLAPR